MHRNAPHLDGQYAAFGKVIEGMDEVNRIAEVQTGYGDKPVSPEIIKEMTVETFGVDYPEPKNVISAAWQHTNRLQRFSIGAQPVFSQHVLLFHLIQSSFGRLPAFQKFRIELPTLVCYAKYSAIIILHAKS